ncbi:hypothetical protein Fot_43324 [Forsythia ovata]|uniref:Uncharacterized protein n=1 Tax=Forsythia ovata TaxID=205694 RepID=A0ABD1RNQ8_9LAMI
MEKGSTSGVQDSLNGLNFGKKIYFEDVDSGVQAKTSGGPLPKDSACLILKKHSRDLGPISTSRDLGPITTRYLTRILNMLAILIVTHGNCLSTLEARWDFIPTVNKKQAKGERIIKVDAQNFGFNGSAKASSCLGIQHSFNEIAAWFFGGRSTTVPM